MKHFSIIKPNITYNNDYYIQYYNDNYNNYKTQLCQCKPFFNHQIKDLLQLQQQLKQSQTLDNATVYKAM